MEHDPNWINKYLSSYPPSQYESPGQEDLWRANVAGEMGIPDLRQRIMALISQMNEAPPDRPSRPPPRGSTAYWAENPPPTYDPKMYNKPTRTAEGGYKLEGKPANAIQTLGELRRVAEGLKGVPPAIAEDIMRKMMGQAGIDPEAARKAAILQILLRHQLEEPGRAETRATARERTEEMAARNQSLKEYQDQILALREKEAEGRQTGRLKQIGEAIQAIERPPMSTDLIAKHGEAGYQALRQQLSQLFMMELIKSLSMGGSAGGEMGGNVTVKRRRE